MSDTIIAALISCVATLTATLIGVFFTNHYRKKGSIPNVDFLKTNDDVMQLMGTVTTILMYTVNSYELLNIVNMALEQNPSLMLNNLTILVRKKNNETAQDIQRLDDIILGWKNWISKRRIKELKIIGYDHDPDHYYTVLGDKMAFSGQVMFDETKPTGTTINYIPLAFWDNTEVGKQVIKNYQEHFSNVVDKYKETLMLYSSNDK